MGGSSWILKMVPFKQLLPCVVRGHFVPWHIVPGYIWSSDKLYAVDDNDVDGDDDDDNDDDNGMTMTMAVLTKGTSPSCWWPSSSFPVQRPLGPLSLHLCAIVVVINVNQGGCDHDDDQGEEEGEGDDDEPLF